MTAQSQTIQFIPLNKLVASQRNVRRKDRKADIDALAASIAAHGLLQNLCVVPGEGDKFEVDAGGRRLLALKQLVKAGAIARDFPVPYHVVACEDGREVSLIENVHRVAMDAMDEVDAYAALIAEGATPDDVARRFGVTRRHVDQRLALAGLAPKIKAAWKRGDVSLEAARAFCLVENRAQQEAVFKSLGRPITHAASVRARLMEGRKRASDRLARFVGLEAYEQAGGEVSEDASPLPKGVIRDLSQARTRAIRLLLARDREIALAVAVAAMIVRSVFRSDLSGIGVAAHPAHVEDLDALVETRGALLAHVPEDEADVLGWCLAQPSSILLALLAVLIANSVDLVHEKGAPASRGSDFENTEGSSASGDPFPSS